MVLCSSFTIFFFTDTATTELYPLSLHDALPISAATTAGSSSRRGRSPRPTVWRALNSNRQKSWNAPASQDFCRFRSEEHTSELQSRENLVCRLLLEKKKKKTNNIFKTL